MFSSDSPVPRCILYRSEELLPRSWKQAPQKTLQTFNPALLRLHTESEAQWLLAYRVVLHDGQRRIAIARLDKHLLPIPESQVAWSDLLPTHCSAGAAIRPWFADPRLYCLGGRYFLYWNSGWHEPENQQYLQEFNVHTLAPVGEPRRFRLEGPRQALEKNWVIFGDGPFYAVYSPSPQRLLHCSLDGEGEILFREIAEHPSEDFRFSETYGALRGGAPPLRVGDQYLSICHCLREETQGLHYRAALYCFDGQSPFAPKGGTVRTLPLGNPFGRTTRFPRLNQAISEVIYPCGAAVSGEDLLISYGINDEHCAISVLPLNNIIEQVGSYRSVSHD